MRLFKRKYHYWLIAFAIPNGGIKYVITRYRNKRLTPARILQASLGRGWIPIVPSSRLLTWEK